MGTRRRAPRSETRKRGVSRGEWLQAGLAALREQGNVAEITIERLARSLGIAKAGFYWHFKDRPELLSAMLDHWIHEVTEVVTDNVALRELDPRSRLIAAAEMILDHDLGQFDLAIRQWALRDQAAARAVRKTDKLRLEFIRGTLEELGFEGDEAQMRAMVFVAYTASESAMFPGVSRRRRRSLIASRIKMLTRR